MILVPLSQRMCTSNHYLTCLLTSIRLQVIMTNRLLLNLSHAATHHNLGNDNATDNGSSRVYQTLAFAHNSVLGNIGAPMNIDEDEDSGSSSVETNGVPS